MFSLWPEPIKSRLGINLQTRDPILSHILMDVSSEILKIPIETQPHLFLRKLLSWVLGRLSAPLWEMLSLPSPTFSVWYESTGIKAVLSLTKATSYNTKRRRGVEYVWNAGCIHVLIAIRGMQLWLQVTERLLHSSQIDEKDCGSRAKSTKAIKNQFFFFLHYLLNDSAVRCRAGSSSVRI